MRVAGVVLCGGKSSRMGRPKAWLPVGNEVMLQRVVRVVGEVVKPVVVVAAVGQDVPPLPEDVIVVRDEVEAKGPLGGLAAGLKAVVGMADAVYLSSCDVPFLTAAFVRRVVDCLLSPSPPGGEGLGVRGKGIPAGPTASVSGCAHPSPPSPLPQGERGENAVAVPRVGGYFHPLAAAYRTTVLPKVLELLQADRLRPVSLFDAVPTRVIEPAELPDLDSLRNVNTPEEYAAVLAEVGQ